MPAFFERKDKSLSYTEKGEASSRNTLTNLLTLYSIYKTIYVFFIMTYITLRNVQLSVALPNLSLKIVNRQNTKLASHFYLNRPTKL